MSDLTREKLREIVATYNPTVWSEPARCRGLLMDLCGEHQQYYEPQINMLIEVLEAKVVDDLRRSSHLPPEVLIPRFTQRLRAKGFAEDLARWGVESWAEALLLVPASGGSGYTPTVLTVSNQGNGRYFTIKQALRDAKHDDTILIGPGVYAEALVIDKPVRIIGDGVRADIVIESLGEPCISLQADAAEIQCLTLRNRVGTANKQYGAVDISRGKLELSDCDIRSDSRACIAVYGATTKPTILRCNIHHGSEYGILIYEGGKGLIKDCVISENARGGIVIMQDGDPIIRECKLHKGRGASILIYENGRGRLEDCEVFDNTFTGVEIRQGGDPTIQGCKFHSGNGRGVLIWEHGRGTIEDCDISGSILAGIEIRRSGNPFIHRCKVHDGRGNGVLVWEHGRGQIVDCEIYNNALTGVEIRQGGDPIIQKCRMHNERVCSLLIQNNGRGQVEGCEIFDNTLVGIEIRDGGDPIIRNCKIREAGDIGVLIQNGGRSTIENCEIYGMISRGIELKQNGNTAIRQCKVYDGREVGVFIHERD